ncbi:hypothetical protein DIPPA_12262 [Diplonema papillatum]|nr:hypothetical protein DIPPA_12262 [Diplonema papillatum]
MASGDAKGGGAPPKRTMHASLVRHLVSDVWARVGPSKLHGVGLIAVREVPKGEVVDRIPLSALPQKQRSQVPTGTVNIAELRSAGIDEDVLSYVLEMYTCPEGGNLEICRYGMNAFLGLAYFVNHSEAPNVAFVNNAGDADDAWSNWKVVTLETVPRGAEMCADYRSLFAADELRLLPGMRHVFGDSAAPVGKAKAAAATALDIQQEKGKTRAPEVQAPQSKRRKG